MWAFPITIAFAAGLIIGIAAVLSAMHWLDRQLDHDDDN